MSVDRAGASEPRTVILVEGRSDQAALEALAGRRGQALDAGGISIAAMGGATNIERFLGRFGPNGLDVRLAGLCDADEEGFFRRALGRAGLGSGLSRAGHDLNAQDGVTAQLEEVVVDADTLTAKHRCPDSRQHFFGCRPGRHVDVPGFEGPVRRRRQGLAIHLATGR